MKNSDDDPNQIGRYAGWGGRDDADARPQTDVQGPGMVPLAYGTNRWGRTLGLLYIPAVILLITVEDWLHVPQVAGWISLVGLIVVFLVIWRVLDRKRG